MAKKIPIYDQRVLDLMANAIGTGRVDSQKDFLESIGFNPTNLKQVKKQIGERGRQSFTVDQMIATCKKYGVTMDWLTGLTNDPTPAKQVKKKTPVQLLEEAVLAVKSSVK